MAQSFFYLFASVANMQMLQMNEDCSSLISVIGQRRESIRDKTSRLKPDAPVQQARSIHPHAQRNAFRRRDARLR
jgi:hypothetical protein